MTKSRAQEFRELLASRALIGDGAMGTMLYSRGVFINRCFDELNLSAPDLVRQIHREYAEAGADILETNTYGANRSRLSGFGLAGQLRAINDAGVRLAREASRGGPFVAGSIGPLGIHIEPLGPTSFEEARGFFREQAEALVAAGTDLLVLETFTSLHELREAVFAAREAAGPDPVIVAMVAVDDDGLVLGAGAEVFTREMDGWTADVIGVNCSVGPKTALEAIERMAQYSAKPLSAMPNAGIPTRVDGRNMYLCSPEYMAQYARRMLWAGVKIVGGCCGTTPDHIRLIAAETRSLQPQQRPLAVTLEDRPRGIEALRPVALADNPGSAPGSRTENS
jgi:homocysteine S-methyltransferase